MNTEQPLIKLFTDLTPYELYEILQARNEVFVVEQNCIYQDADGYDEESIHIVVPFNGEIGAYCRLIFPGIKYPEWSIGRVLTRSHARGKKLAHALTTAALATIAQRGGGNCRISAQSYLEKFYEAHGFIRIGDEYLEDNIPHIEMLRVS